MRYLTASKAPSFPRNVERFGGFASRHGMAFFHIADRDGMDDDVLLSKAFQPGAPAIGVVFSVGENHDGPSLGMFLGIDGHCFDGGIKGRSQVGPAGVD